MTVEAFLTVASILLAVVALIPRERWNDLRIRVGTTARVVLALVVLLECYWTFLEQVHSLPILREVPRTIPWLWTWSPATLSLAALLAAGSATAWSLQRRLSAMRLQLLSDALREATARRHYDESLHLLAAHLEGIRDAMEGRYWTQRLRRRFAPSFSELHRVALAAKASRDRVADEKKTGGGHTADSLALVALPIGATFDQRPPWQRKLIAFADRPLDASHEIARTLAGTPALVSRLALEQPYVGAGLLTLPSSWIKREFAQQFARSLLLDRDSVFYSEIARAQNIDLHNVPIVDAREQPLCHAICMDALSGSEPTLLWPFVFGAIQLVEDRSQKPGDDELRGPLGDYFEKDRWRSGPFAGLYVLELVALRAAVHPGAHTLNLFCVDQYVRNCLNNLPPTAEETDSPEWPTPYHYLIYYAVSLLVDIVDLSRKRPTEYSEVLQRTTGGAQYTIVFQAVEVLGATLQRCLLSTKLSANFKGYLLSVWWQAYADKYRAEPYPFESQLLSSLVRGPFPGSSEMEHREGLKDALEHVDLVLRVSAPGKRLASAFGVTV